MVDYYLFTYAKMRDPTSSAPTSSLIKLDKIKSGPCQHWLHTEPIWCPWLFSPSSQSISEYLRETLWSAKPLEFLWLRFYHLALKKSRWTLVSDLARRCICYTTYQRPGLPNIPNRVQVWMSDGQIAPNHCPRSYLHHVLLHFPIALVGIVVGLSTNIS